MRHEDVRNHLSDYIEGLLDSALAAAIENHLRECEPCRREDTSLRRVFRALEDPTLNVTPPPMFHADAMRRVRLAAQGGADRRGWLERLGWPRAAAAAVGAVAILAAIVISVGPLQHGVNAGFTPEIRSVAVQSPMSAEVIGHIGIGQAFSISLSGVPENASPIYEPSAGFDRGKWMQSAWDGHEIRFAFLPSAAGTVQDVMFYTRNPRPSAALVVFIPVQTGGSAASTVNWRPRPGDTLRSAIQTAARVYGVSISVPESALNVSVHPDLQDANAATALPAIAAAAGLTATEKNGTWQFSAR